MRTLLASLLMVATLGLLGGCAGQPDGSDIAVSQSDIDLLAAEIRAMDPGVDPEEAARAAEISYRYGAQLAQEYGVTDPAVVHNYKVHQGQRPRGLCNHYTEDMDRRLRQERFRTLDLHWAISPPTPLRIIHHSVIISSKGDDMYAGIVLDPWRNGGRLFWDQTVEDTRYNWRPRMEVREELIQERKDREARRLVKSTF